MHNSDVGHTAEDGKTADCSAAESAAQRLHSNHAIHSNHATSPLESCSLPQPHLLAEDAVTVEDDAIYHPEDGEAAACACEVEDVM